MTSFPTSGPLDVDSATESSVAPPRVGEVPIGHEIIVVDGRFAAAHCSCGWRSAGRRSRATVRGEARDHSLLYADGRTAAAE